MQHLASLRLQYLHGDGAGRAGWSLGTVYPIGRLRSRIIHSTKPGVGSASAAAGGGMADGKAAAGGTGGVGGAVEKRKTPSFLDGTLRRSFKTGSLKKQKVGEKLECSDLRQGSNVFHSISLLEMARVRSSGQLCGLCPKKQDHGYRQTKMGFLWTLP